MYRLLLSFSCSAVLAAGCGDTSTPSTGDPLPASAHDAGGSGGQSATGGSGGQSATGGSGGQSATGGSGGEATGGASGGGTGGQAGDSLTFPIRAAFYYPWFPETWVVDGEHVFYHPDLGYYNSDSQEVADRHLDCMDYAKVDVGIFSWWGPETHNEDVRVPMLLGRTAALGSKLKWAAYYEKEGFDIQKGLDLPMIVSDLGYLKNTYVTHETYAHVDGKPVIFVYNADDDDCAVADRWAQATKGEWYVVLKVVPGFKNCANQPDTWHQYGPSSASATHSGYYYSISPGFWRADEPNPRLARNVDRWRENVRDMVASGEPWQLVTTINEWGEGTATEPATEWASDSGFGQYLDALHSDGAP